MPQSLAVSIDEPLVVFDHMNPGQGGPPMRIDWPAVKKSMAALFSSNALRKSVKVAAFCSCLVLAYFLINKMVMPTSTEASGDDEDPDTNKETLFTKTISSIRSALAAFGVFVKKRLESIRERFREQPEIVGIPINSKEKRTSTLESRFD